LLLVISHCSRTLSQATFSTPFLNG
jgi:hypothetical protein